jgi:hypothetical protein
VVLQEYGLLLFMLMRCASCDSKHRGVHHHPAIAPWQRGQSCKAVVCVLVYSSGHGCFMQATKCMAQQMSASDVDRCIWYTAVSYQQLWSFFSDVSSLACHAPQYVWIIIDQGFAVLQ